MASSEQPTGLPEVVVSDPTVLGGAPCFRGTRVPIVVLFDNLEAGVSLDEILAEYPSLDRSDVQTVLREAGRCNGEPRSSVRSSDATVKAEADAPFSGRQTINYA